MHKQLHQNQHGIVAISVTFIIMMLSALVIMSFYRVVQRQQQQAIEGQLNTQAFYAAETAVNDVQEKLLNGLNNAAEPTYNSNCRAFIDGEGLDAELDATTSYTCVLVNMTPTTLEFPSISPGSAAVFPVQAGDGGDLNQVTFSWHDPTVGSHSLSSCPSKGSFPTSWPSDCKAGGLLRVDLVPVSGNLDRNGLINSTFTGFLQPENGRDTPDYSSGTGLGGQGLILRGNCSNATKSATSKFCSVTINITSPVANQYYARVSSIYRDASVTVTAKSTVSGGSDVTLIGAQAIVDATGKASDALRRIQVRLKLSSLGDSPLYALETGDTLCKQYRVTPPDIVDNPDIPEACKIQ